LSFFLSAFKFKVVLNTSSSSIEYGMDDTDAETAAVLFENQRWIMGLWRNPVALLDVDAWVDERGDACEAPSTSAWTPVIDTTTDDEGWQYGTVFHHLEHERAGGRASQRLGDVVRRRVWVPRQGASNGQRGECGQTVGADLLTLSQQNKRFQRVHAYESNRKALREFLRLVVDVISRERFWKTLPWDPAALFVLSKRHAEEYQAYRDVARTAAAAAAATSATSATSLDAMLLKRLLCAATHSRAAYGFAMAGGHVSSVSSYIKLQTVQPLRFDVVGGVSRQANEEAIRSLTGVGGILQSNFRNGPFRPCYYVAADEANKCVVVAVRGSLQIGDLLSDVNASSVRRTMLGVEGWIHEGMLTSASYIHCCIKDVLSKECARDQRRGWPVLVTGHSLGGGVASVLAMMLRESGDLPPDTDVQCATIGSAAVMSKALAERSAEWCTSVILGSDPVGIDLGRRALAHRAPRLDAHSRYALRSFARSRTFRTRRSKT